MGGRGVDPQGSEDSRAGVAMTTHRGTSNSNERGNTATRRVRRNYLTRVYASDVAGHCRCYRCGLLLCDAPDSCNRGCAKLTVDRVTPAVMGGRYKRDNIRPACGACNSTVGGALSGKRRVA